MTLRISVSAKSFAGGYKDFLGGGGPPLDHHWRLQKGTFHSCQGLPLPKSALFLSFPLAWHFHHFNIVQSDRTIVQWNSAPPPPPPPNIGFHFPQSSTWRSWLNSTCINADHLRSINWVFKFKSDMKEEHKSFKNTKVPLNSKDSVSPSEGQ